MIDAQLTVRAARATRQVALADYLDGEAEERAHEESYAWIKGLRALPVDGAPLRDRFTARGDSLWWFTELYLHKERVILDSHRTILALEALLDREAPAGLDLVTGSLVVRHIAPRVAAARGVRCGQQTNALTWWTRLAALDVRARSLTLTGLAAADRWRRPPAGGSVAIGAFIHRAFWRTGARDGSAESYIGPILSELEQRLGAQAVGYVGVGPAANFRTGRRWSLLGGAATSVTPIERLAGWSALSKSRSVWRQRSRNFRALRRAPSLRAATIMGIDCWPLVREQLAGIAWLQWPWSVRAMDEAAAALEALQPGAVVTYAEAGGWGRALILEARRRGIPSAGLQHGFIHRHWLNYRHERDEMEPGVTPPFPHPTRTLLFDGHAARHLETSGHFPSASLCVTGSPRLDELAREMAAMSPSAIRSMRQELGIGDGKTLVLVATKEKEARASLGGLVEAVAAMPDAVLVIKPHPAETVEAYHSLAGPPHVRIVPAATSLAGLLASARAVVTVNSTVALDAAALGIPALAIGLPNNLSPFVEAGAIAGSSEPAETSALLGRILYDERFRQQLVDRRRALFGEPASGRGRGAAARSADAVLELIQPRRAGAARTE